MKPSIPFIPFALILAVSCASAPPPVKPAPSPVAVSAPEWTTRTTFMEGDNLVFVLVGPENADVVSLALQAMTSYLDLAVGPDTPEIAAQAIQKFLAAMSATKPSDRFTRNGRGYWKVAVPEEQWNSSRAQLAALFKASVDPSLPLEKGADALLQKGRFFDAATGYVAAAAAASSSGRTGPRIRGALTKALEILSKLTLSSVTPAQTTRVGQPFETPFVIKLAYGASSSAPAAADVPLRFSYKVKKNGRLAVSGQTVKTDAQGAVVFDLPVPDFSVRDSLVILVDINPLLEMMVTLPEENRDLVSAFEKLVSEKKLQLPYTVESASKKIPMVVALADFDDKGTVQKRQESTTALISGLQKAGFQVSGIPVNPTLLKSTNDAVVLAAWKFQGKTTGRAVYGTVSVVSVVPSGSQYSAEVTGTVKVADLGTGKPVYQLTTSQVASAADKTSAITQAFRQWGGSVAANLDSELP